ncbi:MAG TPA: ribonuclease Z [Acidimicrobiales bacterium]|nr:ribonuclease Z [Acidimicrobiales bacterium]
MRELVVLGTASQVPTRHRNHNGYLLRWDGEGFLFDPGEGTQRQFLFAGVAPSSVTRICLTHFHGDHCLGLPGVLQRLSLDGVAGPVSVCFPAGGAVYLDRLRHASQYADRTAVEPVPVSGPGPVIDTGAVSLLAAPLDHGVETVGWRVQEPDGRRMLPDRLAAAGVHGPAVGRLQQQGSIEVGERTVLLEEVSAHRPGQSFALIMDTRPCEGARRLADGVDMLVCEATFSHDDRDLAERYGHMTATQAAELAREAGAGRLVLTHFSQRYSDLAPLVAEARAVFPDAVAAADLDRIAVPARRA